MDLLLIIRGLAAISVVIWHAGGYAVDLPLLNVPGRTAVWIFFGISGYVIAYGFIHKRYEFNAPGLKNFYLNRFLRIYPLFLLLSLLGWLTNWAQSGTNPIAWMDVPSQFLGLQFNHAYTLNSVFWTLGLEIQFYMIAPAMATLFFIANTGRRWFSVAVFYVGLLAIHGLAVTFRVWSLDGRNLISVLPHFLIGMVGCQLVMNHGSSNKKAIAFLVCGLLCLAGTNWLYHRHLVLFWSFGTVLVDGMILLFIFSHASLQPSSKSISGLTRFLLWMGTLSYGIYAWHPYLMSSFQWVATNWAVLLLVSVAFAFASYRWVELPALKLKRWGGSGKREEGFGVTIGSAASPEDPTSFSVGHTH